MAGTDDAEAPQLRPSLITAAGPGRGYRNFMSKVPPGQCFGDGDGGLFHVDGKINEESRKTLRRRMRAIATRFRLLEPEKPNLKIPSGYVYLLQFIAHDMVDSTASWSAGGSGGTEFSVLNARTHPLCLDTLYGSGPAAAPHVYAATPARAAHPDALPRTRLKLGPQKKRQPADRFNLRCDIGRGVDSNDLRPALKNLREVEDLRNYLDNVPTIPLVADARNDAHAIISQLTALFHEFHNRVMQMVDASGGTGPNRPPTEDHLRRFLCARTAVTLVYRQIILRDVLPKILHPNVASIYLPDGRPDFAAVQDTSDGIPVEFSHGAFRFAHAMSRKVYRVNAGNAQGDFWNAFLQTSSRATGIDVLTDDWLVDWAYYFDTGLAGVSPDEINYSNIIQPRYAIDSAIGMEPKDPLADLPGLATRDLMSSAYARCWSVKHLISIMQARPIWSTVVRPYDSRFRDEIADAFAADRSADEDGIFDDPPLPLFILCEAQQASGGQYLGPVGSILVAEAILGAIKSRPIAPTGELAEQLDMCAKALLKEGCENVLDTLVTANIDSMPTLLAFLAEHRSFGDH